MYKPTIGLDFGSAYTKLAYRPAFPSQEKGRFAEQESEILTFGSSALIPSIVIYTGNRKKPWLCGSEAAELKPGKDWQVFRNWKSDIFSRNFSSRKDKIRPAAVTFFSWLLKQTRSSSVRINKNTRIRVSVPELGRLDRQKTFLRECMKESGWVGRIEFVSEPIANATGIFSGGKNFVSAEGFLSYMPMFGQHFMREMNVVIEQIRAYLVEKTRSERYLRLAIIDCGGFTLDAAVLSLDLKVEGYTGLPFEVESSQSKNIGVIKQIDDKALPRLFKAHGINENAVTFEAQELAKYGLYSGASHNMFVEDKIYYLGESKKDKDIVIRALDDYCERVWESLSDLNWRNIEYVILTGGGSNISPVKKYLESRFRKKGVDRIIFFSENQSTVPGKPKGRLLSATEHSKVFGRVATALGDASIALGFDM